LIICYDNAIFFLRLLKNYKTCEVEAGHAGAAQYQGDAHIVLY